MIHPPPPLSLRTCASSVEAPKCGVQTSLGCCSSSRDDSGGGSELYTSRAAEATCSRSIRFLYTVGKLHKERATSGSCALIAGGLGWGGMGWVGLGRRGRNRPTFPGKKRKPDRFIFGSQPCPTVLGSFVRTVFPTHRVSSFLVCNMLLEYA